MIGYQSFPKTLSYGANNWDYNRLGKSCLNLFLNEVSLDTMDTLRTAQWKIKLAVSTVAQALERLREGKMGLDCIIIC